MFIISPGAAFDNRKQSSDRRFLMYSWCRKAGFEKWKIFKFRNRVLAYAKYKHLFLYKTYDITYLAIEDCQENWIVYFTDTFRVDENTIIHWNKELRDLTGQLETVIRVRNGYTWPEVLSISSEKRVWHVLRIPSGQMCCKELLNKGAYSYTWLGCRALNKDLRLHLTEPSCIHL